MKRRLIALLAAVAFLFGIGTASAVQSQAATTKTATASTASLKTATSQAATAKAVTPAATVGATGAITGYEGLCLDDRSASTTPGNPVQVYTCNGTSAQQWTYESNGTIQTLGECLDVTGAGTANGTLVDLYTCNSTAAQVWEPQSNGELVNPTSGKCLDDTGYGGSGTQVQIWTCADTSNQEWSVP